MTLSYSAKYKDLYVFLGSTTFKSPMLKEPTIADVVISVSNYYVVQLRLNEVFLWRIFKTKDIDCLWKSFFMCEPDIKIHGKSSTNLKLIAAIDKKWGHIFVFSYICWNYLKSEVVIVKIGLEVRPLGIWPCW